MKTRFLLTATLIAVGCTISAFGQAAVLINDPTADSQSAPLTPDEESIIRRQVLPAVARKIADEICVEEFEAAGSIKGSFSKPGSDQTVVFYQFCQTGNGLGKVGLVLIENGKAIRSYESDGGWSVNLTKLPDINMNGLDEFGLHYSGGMHQGQGGTGVDIMEFTASGLKGIGWFQADAFFDDADSIGWKVTVKKGKIPVFYREKYTATEEEKWRKAGRPARFTLGKIYSKFVAVK